jgi:hypothetical protein
LRQTTCCGSTRTGLYCFAAPALSMSEWDVRAPTMRGQNQQTMARKNQIRTLPDTAIVTLPTDLKPVGEVSVLPASTFRRFRRESVINAHLNRIAIGAQPYPKRFQDVFYCSIGVLSAYVWTCAIESPLFGVNREVHQRA